MKGRALALFRKKSARQAGSNRLYATVVIEAGITTVSLASKPA